MTDSPPSESFPREVPFQFTGAGGEYFRIWIVNLALSILTLGIYSAWAKVRRLNYFYGNARLEGLGFTYLANPKNILIGRILVVIGLAAFLAAERWIPGSQGATTLLFILLWPWLVCRARSFNLKNTAFRNVRFGFDGTYPQAFGPLVVRAFLTGVTLGLLYPHFLYARNRFAVSFSRFGKTGFGFTATPGDFHSMFWKSVGWVILMVILGAVLMNGLILSVAAHAPKDLNPSEAVHFAVMTFLPVAGFALPMLLLRAYFLARTANLVMNHITLDGKPCLRSELSPFVMMWLYASNAALIIVTLGLFTPWARVRMADYRASRLTFLDHGVLERVLTDAGEESDALGEEAGDFMDVDVDVGF